MRWALILLLPTLAGAAELVSVKDRRGGYLEDVRKLSAEVTRVRDGAEEPAELGGVVGAGDAIRTARGAATVRWADGTVVVLGEGSQLSLQEPWVQRIGEAVYDVPGHKTVQAGPWVLQLDDAEVHVVVARDVAVVSVLRGAVGVEGPSPVELSAGQLLKAGGAPTALANDQEDGIRAWRDSIEGPAPRRGAQGDRLWVRAAGGFAYFDQLLWGQGSVDARVRLLGPIWVGVGGSFAARRGTSGDPGPTAWAVPIWAGGRGYADLPGGWTVGGGVEFVGLVAERCTGSASCLPGVVFEPGVRGALGGGLLLGKRLGFELEVAGGVLRRTVPSVADGGSDSVLVDPLIGVQGGVFLRF